eukprot:3602766-Rhodomonas_salina.1
MKNDEVPTAPDDTKQCIAVSAIHAVCSQPVDPSVTCRVESTSPNSAPRTRKLVEPVLGPLKSKDTCGVAGSKMAPGKCETTSVPVPVLSPEVTITLRLPPRPAPSRHRTLVSASQNVESVPVDWMRTAFVSLLNPKSRPVTERLETLTDPARASEMV